MKFNKNINFSGNWLKFLITAAALILVGVLVICIWNFNLGTDFNGGTVMEVTLGEHIESEANEEKAREIITDTIKDKGIDISLVQTSGFGSAKGFIIKYENVVKLKSKSDVKMQAINEEIKAKLSAKFLEKGWTTASIEADIFEPAVFSENILGKLILGISVAAVAVFVFYFIRYRLFTALMGLSAIILNVLLTLAVMAICRTTVNSNEFVSIGLTALYSVALITFMLSRYKINLKETPDFKECANKTINEQFLSSLVINGIIAVVLIVCACIVPATVKTFIMPLIVGVITSAFVANFLVLPLASAVKAKYAKRHKYEGLAEKNN